MSELTKRAFFDEKSKEWRDQQKEIDARVVQLASVGLRSAKEAAEVIRCVSDTCRRFEQEQPEQQRAIVSALLKNGTWKAGMFETSLKSPYDVLGTFELCKRKKRKSESRIRERN